MLDCRGSNPSVRGTSFEAIYLRFFFLVDLVVSIIFRISNPNVPSPPRNIPMSANISPPFLFTIIIVHD